MQLISHPFRTARALTGVTAAALLLTACGAPAEESSAAPKVCVDQYTTATVISDIVEGLEDTLRASIPDIEIDLKNPQGDTGTEQTIAQQFLTAGCDVIVPITTGAGQLHVNMGSDIPIVFTGSATPVEAGIIPQLEQPGGNVTGVASILNPVPDIDAMHEMMPDMQTVGLIWRLGDPAGDAQTEKAQQRLDELGIEYVEATITNGNEVTQAAQSLVDRVDAIEIPGDTITLSSVSGVVSVADSVGIPVFGGSAEVVDDGGVLSSTYDYVEVGAITAELVLRVLDGEDPGTIDAVVPDAFMVKFNDEKLEFFGLEQPAE